MTRLLIMRKNRASSALLLAARRLYFYAPDLAGRNIEKLLKAQNGRSEYWRIFIHAQRLPDAWALYARPSRHDGRVDFTLYTFSLCVLRGVFLLYDRP